MISGASGTDSAFAILPAPLVVEVHDSSGRPAKAGTPVRFEPLSHENGYIPDVGTVGIPEVFVRAPNDIGFGGVMPLEYPTDAFGRVLVQVRLGVRAGIARMRISSPTLGGDDTVRYTVVPGNPNSITLTPYDTAVTAGASVAFRGVSIDRGGNPRADPITWSVSPNTIDISPSGVVSATKVGQYTVTAFAAFGATARLTVLP
jgi:hypothetical protein